MSRMSYADKLEQVASECRLTVAEVASWPTCDACEWPTHGDDLVRSIIDREQWLCEGCSGDEESHTDTWPVYAYGNYDEQTPEEMEDPAAVWAEDCC